MVNKNDVHARVRMVNAYRCSGREVATHGVRSKRGNGEKLSTSVAHLTLEKWPVTLNNSIVMFRIFNVFDGLNNK